MSDLKSRVSQLLQSRGLAVPTRPATPAPVPVPPEGQAQYDALEEMVDSRASMYDDLMVLEDVYAMLESVLQAMLQPSISTKDKKQYALEIADLKGPFWAIIESIREQEMQLHEEINNVSHELMQTDMHSADPSALPVLYPGSTPRD